MAILDWDSRKEKDQNTLGLFIVFYFKHKKTGEEFIERVKVDQLFTDTQLAEMGGALITKHEIETTVKATVTDGVFVPILKAGPILTKEPKVI